MRSAATTLRRATSCGGRRSTCVRCLSAARTRGQVAQARARLNQARLSVSEQLLDLEVEVRRALSSLQEAGELAEAAGKVVEQATEALRLADAMVVDNVKKGGDEVTSGV